MQTPPGESPQGTAEKRALLAKLLRDSTAPASFGQQALWVEAHLEPESTAYNIPIGLRISGPLRMEVLERSLSAIVERHDSLRTTFELRGEELSQIISGTPRFEWTAHDLTACADAHIEMEAHARAAASAAEPFDLERGPLFRATLLKLRPQDHILICTLHHIVSDAWSGGILIRELASNYEALSQDIGYRPEPLQFQFRDFAAWQRQYSETEMFHQQVNYWVNRLRGAPAVLNLPSDRPRSRERTSKSGRHSLVLDRPLADCLEAVAKHCGVTFFVLMLAAFKVLLYRYTGQTDIVVGVPVAGRNHVETEPLIGFFVNTVLLRSDLSGNPKFSTLLQQLRAGMVQALANQEVPFEKLVQQLRPPRSAAYNPLFQVMFTTFKGGLPCPRFGPLTASLYDLHPSTTRLDLTLSLIEEAGRNWCIRADYSRALFDSERIRRLLGHYVRTLDSIAGSEPQ